MTIKVLLQNVAGPSSRNSAAAVHRFREASLVCAPPIMPPATTVLTRGLHSFGRLFKVPRLSNLSQPFGLGGQTPGIAHPINGVVGRGARSGVRLDTEKGPSCHARCETHGVERLERSSSTRSLLGSLPPPPCMR